MERIECCGNCAHYDACNSIMKDTPILENSTKTALLVGTTLCG